MYAEMVNSELEMLDPVHEWYGVCNEHGTLIGLDRPESRLETINFCDDCRESAPGLVPLVQELRELRLQCQTRQAEAVERGEERLTREEYATDIERVHLLETLLASDLSLYARLYEHVVAFATGVRVDPTAYDGGRVTGTRGYKSEVATDDFTFLDFADVDHTTDSLDTLVLLAEYELKSIVENEKWRDMRLVETSEQIISRVERVEEMTRDGIMSASTSAPILDDLMEEFERVEIERVATTPTLRLANARTRKDGRISYTNSGMTRAEIDATVSALVERVKRYGLRPVMPRVRTERPEIERVEFDVTVRRASAAEIAALNAAKVEQLPISYRRTSTVKFLTGNPNGIVKKSEFDQRRETETRATVKRATSLAAKMRKRLG